MYEAGLEIQEVTESSTITGPHAIILTVKQSSSLFDHPLRLKDRLCRHSVNTDLSPLHPSITQSVIHGEQSQTVKFNLLKLSASSPLDVNDSKYLHDFWTASFKTNWFHEREQRKEDHCHCPMPSAQPSWWAKVTHCSLTVSFQGSLSLMHSARDCKLQGQGFYPFCPSTSLAHRRRATSSCAANSYFILSPNRRQSKDKCMWSPSSRRRWSVQTDLSVGRPASLREEGRQAEQGQSRITACSPTQSSLWRGPFLPSLPLCLPPPSLVFVECRFTSRTDWIDQARTYSPDLCGPPKNVPETWKR